jgi:hypothetical protein
MSTAATDTFAPPRTALAWLIWAWGIGGVCLFLLNPIIRLGSVAVEALVGGLTTTQASVAVVWVVFMLYSEGYRGFHKQFAPRVAVRALALARDPRPALVLVAPFMCMGLLHASPKRLKVAWSLLLMISVMVVAVRQLPAPWRGIVDLGVVLGLASGLMSILWFAGRSVMGDPPRVSADLPA